MDLQDFYYILQGLPVTLSISFFSFLIGFVIGIPLSIIRQHSSFGVRVIAEGYEKVLRGIPVLVLMLAFHFGLGGIIPIFKDSYMSAVIALGLRSGAYQGQIFLGAINSVGRSQMMAATSLGMNRWQAFRHVILPQAFIVALPGLGSEISLLIKDSSYSFILGVLDLTKHADIVRRATKSFLLPYLSAALLYISITFPVANYLDKLGSKFKTKYGLR